MDFVIFLQRILEIAFYMCTNVRGAKAREPQFEKEPPSIPVTVGNFKDECARR